MTPSSSPSSVSSLTKEVPLPPSCRGSGPSSPDPRSYPWWETVNLPPRDEGDHLCVGLLVAQESRLMLSCAPYTGGAGKHLPEELRLSRLEEGLWGWIRNGWTRIRDDGTAVYWHPEASDWVPFTRSLHNYYTDYWGLMRHWLEQKGG